MKPRYGPSSALLMNISLLLKDLNFLFYLYEITYLQYTIQSKLFITSLVITDYSISDVKNSVH